MSLTTQHKLLPGLNWKLRVEDAGRDAKLLQEQFEPVAPVNSSHKQQRLSLNQLQLQKSVDEQELVFLLTFDGVLLQLAAVWELRALKLQDHLRRDRSGSGDKIKQNNSKALRSAIMALQGESFTVCPPCKIHVATS